MLMKGSLNAHLEEVDQAADKMLDRLIIQMVERENITEVLIASNQVEWVRRMNSIRNSAVEVVMNDLIYV